MNALLVLIWAFGPFTLAHMNHEDQRSFFSAFSAINDPSERYGTGSPYWFYPAVVQSENPTQNATNNRSKRSASTENQISRIYGRNYAKIIGFLPDILQDLLLFILDNPFVGVIGLGSIIALIKQYFWRFYNKIHNQYTTTMEVSSDHQTYNWLENWLNAKNWGDCQHVTAVISRTPVRCDYDDDWDDEDEYDDENEGAGPGGAPNFQLIPNLSHYGFEYKGQWIDITRGKEKDKEEAERYAMGHNRSLFAKTLTLSTKGKDPTIFHHLLSECRQRFIEQTKIGTCVWTTCHGGWCSSGGQRRKRPLESVVLDQGVLEEIMADIKKFIASSKWYIDRGIPYRRGYLLYGPPGCGKTSIISAIAGYLDYGISILSLSDSFMNDDNLRNLLNSVPERSILLLEDIDAAFQSRTKGNNSRGFHDNSVSFSGLLNAIDGVASADARILFMTTNYVDRLDSALIRPGRVDLRKKIDYCSEYQIRALFRRFYPQLESTEAENLENQFVSGLKTDSNGGSQMLQMTPAQVQGYLLIYRDDAMAAVQNLSTFREEMKENTEKQKIPKAAAAEDKNCNDRKEGKWKKNKNRQK